MNQKIFAGLAVCLLAASCAAPDANVSRSGTVSSKHGAGSDMPVPPEGAQYTIYCQGIAGPDHLERSRALRQLLIQSTPMKDWYVIHATDQSTLYYGFYRS